MNGDDRIRGDRKNSALRIWCSRDRQFRWVENGNAARLTPVDDDETRGT